MIATAVVEASFKCNASCIIVLTRSGASAQLIAKYRPRCPIYAVTRFEQVRLVHSLLIVLMPRPNLGCKTMYALPKYSSNSVPR